MNEQDYLYIYIGLSILGSTVILLPLIILAVRWKAINLHALSSAANAQPLVNSATPQSVSSSNVQQSSSSKSNTNWTTIFTAVFILVTTVVAFCTFYFTHQVSARNLRTTSVTWKSTDSLKIRSGPVWFCYEADSAKLITSHAITEADKSQLLGLADQKENYYYAYCRAIDLLAFRSNAVQDGKLYGWLTLLYALAGVIGVQLRTINNFIGIACFKNEFDFHRWWPWYLVRPLLGFITGAVVFMLIDGKQLLAGQLSGGISATVLAVAFLGGFGTDEFYELLRKLSKGVFGKEK